MLERYRHSLLDLFSAVRQLSETRGMDRALCQAVQETLLQKITYVERNIRKGKAEIAHYRHLLRGGSPTRLTKAEARELKEAISYCHATIDDYQSLLTLLHKVGDAVAFIYLNKWDIKPLAFRQAPGFISGKKGTRLERKIMRKIFELGAVAILNDLTTCLRHGDVTIPLGESFIVYEAKSGRRQNNRDINQMAEINKVVNYIDSDRTENLYGHEGLFVRRSISVPERNHLGWLNRLVRQAKQSGEASRQVERGLYYLVTYLPDSPLLIKALQSCEKPPVGAMVNTYKYDNNGYYPFTLSIQDPVALYDFYAGHMVITVIVDTSVLESDFASKGFQIDFVNNEQHAFTLTSPKLPFEDNMIGIGRHFWERVYTEFLSTRWYIEEIEQRFAKLDIADIHETKT
jgi:hypothetical protein